MGRGQKDTHYELVLSVQGEGLFVCAASCFWRCYGSDPACASVGRPLTGQAACMPNSTMFYSVLVRSWLIPVHRWNALHATSHQGTCRTEKW